MTGPRFFVCLGTLAVLMGGFGEMILADQERHGRGFYRTAADQDDDDNGRQGHHGRKRSGQQGTHSLGPVDNQIYKDQCGACHFAYQPGLLPSGSWGKILDRLPEHFGESFEVEPGVKTTITRYLEGNAADRSRAKRAVKIAKGLHGQTPTRITEVPYIREKHHKISPEVLKRQSIRSLANCAACHREAAAGIYDDDTVLIPE